MRSLMVLITLLVAMLLSTGCGEGVAITQRERQERHKRIVESDWKQIQDDWDAFWLLDRPGRLSWSRLE